MNELQMYGKSDGVSPQVAALPSLLIERGWGRGKHEGKLFTSPSNHWEPPGDQPGLSGFSQWNSVIKPGQGKKECCTWNVPLAHARLISQELEAPASNAQ